MQEQAAAIIPELDEAETGVELHAVPESRLERLGAVSHAVAAAHDGALHRAIAGFSWERRGFLQRLKRT